MIHKQRKEGVELTPLNHKLDGRQNLRCYKSSYKEREKSQLLESPEQKKGVIRDFDDERRETSSFTR